MVIGMTDDDKRKAETGNPEDIKERAEYTPSVQSDFLREKMKQRPVNKKKLLRRTIVTVVLAVVFGIVACLTFLILEPVINNWLYPPEEAKEVQFPEETITEEMNPEDMLTVEEQEKEEPVELELELVDEKIAELLSEVTFGLEEYRTVYDELSALAKDVSRSIVTVTGVTSDVDWFNNIYESEAVASGVIVANNEQSMLILVNMKNIKDAEKIVVTFCDQTQTVARLVQKDASTGFAILSVSLMTIGEKTMDVITIATLGSSNTGNLPGTPVMALGSPMGTSGSVCYGIITSSSTVIDQVDSAYKLMSTDMYGSKNATGVLVDLKGMVIGIIDNSYNSSDRGNLISAYGISELKRTIAKMSNNQYRAYLGIHGADVPLEAILESDVPRGAYIKEIEMDSPAMTAGIQSGDVIVQINDTEIATYSELLNELYNSSPDDVVTITLMRQGIDSFQEMKVTVTLARRE